MGQTVSKLDDVLVELPEEEANFVKPKIKGLMLDLVLSIDKSQVGNETSHELAVLVGHKDALLELYKKVKEL